jgi:hypothetical protein
VSCYCRSESGSRHEKADEISPELEPIPTTLPKGRLDPPCKMSSQEEFAKEGQDSAIKEANPAVAESIEVVLTLGHSRPDHPRAV